MSTDQYYHEIPGHPTKEFMEKAREIVKKSQEAIHGAINVVGRYNCKNRMLGSAIRLDTVLFGVRDYRYFLTCETHGDHKDDNISKKDALFWMRKPWLWCDGCAEIHFNKVWKP